MLSLRRISAHHLIAESSSGQNIVIYDKLPKKYTKRDEWPSRTDLSCLYCSRKIPSFPIPIITKIHDDGWETYHQYCTFSCAREYIYHVMDDELGNENKTRRDELINMLRLLAKEFNIDMKDVPRPRKLSDMLFYGGDTSPYQWGEHLI